MKTDIITLTKARDLLDELEQLEEACDVLGNYDARSYALLSTFHNNNKNILKEVRIPMPDVARKPLIEYIHERMAEIKKKLEQL